MFLYMHAFLEIQIEAGILGMSPAFKWWWRGSGVGSANTWRSATSTNEASRAERVGHAHVWIRHKEPRARAIVLD